MFTTLATSNWILGLVELTIIGVLGVGMIALVRARKALPAFSKPAPTLEDLYRCGKITFGEYQQRLGHQ